MQVLKKIQEAFVSVMPIMGIVGVLHCTVTPLGPLLAPFLIGGLLLILGLGIFLLGTEISMVPIGSKAGAALTAKRSLPLMLAVGFAIGFFVTVAEPDVQVLAVQVAAVAPNLSPTLLVLMIGLGVGLFVSVAMGRSVLRVSLKLLLAGCYLLVFICAYFTDPGFLGIAFDAGGATTGPMTVPFIMALGVGVASVYSRGGHAEDQSFGFIGLASVGPVLAVLLLGIFTHPDSGGTLAAQAGGAGEASLWAHFTGLLPHITREVAVALGPLAVLCILFQLFLLHMPPVQLARMGVGFVYTALGLILFFLGVQGGFMPAGLALGGQLAALPGGLLIPAGILFGAVVVCAEPAVWVLNDQVEQVSGGHIKARVMLVSLSAGVAMAVGIAMLRVSFGLSIWWFLIPGYALAFGLAKFCPSLFTAIAFDSGGVASGPMASTFILSFTLGASHALGGNPITDAFGVIAMIAMTPLITIQLLGILYERKRRAAEKPAVPAKD